MTLFAADKIELFPEPLPGIVEEAIAVNNPGRVKFQYTYWPARLYRVEGEIVLYPDQFVIVIGRQGLTLLVIPTNN